jgi:hypothetical protein
LRRWQRPALGWADLLLTVVGVLAAVVVTLGVRQCLVWGRIEARVEVLTSTWAVAPEHRVRMGRIFERELRPLLSSPRFDRYVDEQMAAFGASGRPDELAAFRNNLGSALEERGRARLPDADLAVFLALRTRIAHTSERVCACNFDSSPCSPADVMDGLARLTDDELAAWYRLAAKAGLAELEADAPAPSTQASFDEGIQAIIDGLSPQERERFLAVWQGRSVDRGEQCFAIRTIFAGAKSLEPAMRARFTRALANLGNKQP